MEIDITRFFNESAPRDYSASVAEIGATAGADTWRAACDDSAEFLLLDDDEKREAFRAFVIDSGGWADDEVRAWRDDELNALFLQWIAGDMREPVGFELGAETTPEQWADYESQCEAGQCAGRIFRADDGRIYFQI